MARDWLKPPKKRPETLSDLIAAKDYPRAIEMLRAQLARRPGIQTRLQFADLLLLAGRQEEAMPIFVGLADELTSDGFVAKAVAILKRIDRLQPGRPDIESRLAQLARQPARSTPAVPPGPPAAPPPQIGMEEIDPSAPLDAPPAETPAPAEAPAPPESTVTEAPPAAAAPPSVPAEEPPTPTPASEPTPPEVAPASSETASPTTSEVASTAAPESQAEPAPPPSEAPPAPGAAPPEPAPAREPAGLGALLKRLFHRKEAEPPPAVPVPPVETSAAETTASETSSIDTPAAMTEPSTATDATSGEIAITVEEDAAADAAVGPSEKAAAAGPETASDGPRGESATEARPETTADASPQPPVVEPPPTGPTSEAPPEPATAEVVTMPEAVASPEPSEAMAPETPATAEPSEPPPVQSPAVVEKFGGVFKRFLESLPGGDSDEPDDSDRVMRDFAETLEAAGLDADDDEDAVFQAFIDDEEDLIGADAKGASEAAAAATTEESPVAAPRVEATVEAAAPVSPTWTAPMSEAGFRDQVLDLIEEVLKRPPDPTDPGETTEPIASAYRDELLAHPLFRDLSEDAMLAMLRALRFVCFEPGEIVVSEGEPGGSLFLVISGDVKLFVRNPVGRNVPVGKLTEGSFFGEMSLLSGRPRNATVTAAGRVDLLELPKPLLDGIAQLHPRVRDTVDALYVQRASSAEVSAVRNISTGDAETRQRAMQILKAYFGGRRWEPRMQLKLAMVLLKAGKEEEAVPVLVDLADTLLRAGEPAKAIGILKKVELIRTQSLQVVVNLAPLVRPGPAAESASAPAPGASPPSWAGRTQGFFEDWLGSFRRSVASSEAPTPRRIPGYGPELVASPLFEGFTEEELLAFMQGLRLNLFEPGDIILTEGERGESVFILTTGTVKVFVRNPAGHDIELCELKEGAFFGEMSTLSGRPRTATVTATSRCELLELDRSALDQIAATHPRVRQVLEEVYIERASSTQAARIRTTALDQPEA